MATLVNNVDVFVLHGSPGSGKSTLSGAIAGLLRESGLANAVIDLDDLTMVYPHPERSFALNNLRAVWPNYATIAGLRLVIPSVIADEDERVQLRAAVPGSRFVVCELTAPETVLKERALHGNRTSTGAAGCATLSISTSSGAILRGSETFKCRPTQGLLRRRLAKSSNRSGGSFSLKPSAYIPNAQSLI